MKYLHFPPDLALRPIRLNEEELKDPLIVIREFFSFYDLNSTRLELHRWLEYAFASDDEDLKNGTTRVDLLQFSYQLEALLEATYLLHIK
jgi:hypothetical protein